MLTISSWIYLVTNGDVFQALCGPSAEVASLQSGSLVFGVWLAMSLAMMLPAATPMISTYLDIAEAARDEIDCDRAATGFRGGLFVCLGGILRRDDPVAAWGRSLAGHAIAAQCSSGGLHSRRPLSVFIFQTRLLNEVQGAHDVFSEQLVGPPVASAANGFGSRTRLVSVVAGH